MPRKHVGFFCHRALPRFGSHDAFCRAERARALPRPHYWFWEHWCGLWFTLPNLLINHTRSPGLVGSPLNGLDTCLPPSVRHHHADGFSAVSTAAVSATAPVIPFGSLLTFHCARRLIYLYMHYHRLVHFSLEGAGTCVFCAHHH